MRISDWSSDVLFRSVPSTSTPIAPDKVTRTGSGIETAPNTGAAMNAAPIRTMTKINAQSCGSTARPKRSEEHTSELQTLMSISYAVFCLKKKNHNITRLHTRNYLKHHLTHADIKT